MAKINDSQVQTNTASKLRIYPIITPLITRLLHLINKTLKTTLSCVYTSKTARAPNSNGMQYGQFNMKPFETLVSIPFSMPLRHHLVSHLI